MRVKSVEYQYALDRIMIELEHNEVTWFKFFNLDDNPTRLCDGIKTLLNSVIEDTLARDTKWDR